MRDVVDAYMASYTGRDVAMAQRLTFWVEAIGEVRLRDVEADLITDHLDQLAAQPVRRYVGRDAEGHRLYRAHRPRSGATVKRYKNALSAVLTWARKRRLAPKGWRNPAHDVASAPEAPGRTRFVSKAECDWLLKVARVSAWPKLHLLILMPKQPRAFLHGLGQKHW